MTAIYLIRHPQTEWNLSERYQGRLDAPLSSLGTSQAGELTQAFADLHFDSVVTSPLGRARRLGEQLADCTQSPLVVDQRLVEIGLGVWEGLYRGEIERFFPELYTQWYTQPDRVSFPLGETLSGVQARAISAMSSIMDRWPEGHVAVITHSNVIQTVVAAALGLDRSRIHSIRVANCSVTTLCGTEAPGSLLSLNATDALFPSIMESATAQNCVSWRHRRMTA